MIRTIVQTGSTNDDVAALAREGAPEGTWLRADRQSGGKGRQGRAWQSPAGKQKRSRFRVVPQVTRCAAHLTSLFKSRFDRVYPGSLKSSITKTYYSLLIGSI